jgi:micrococcal nuclease
MGYCLGLYKAYKLEMHKMRKLRCKAYLILSLFLITNTAFALTVTRAIDGDTIELSDGQKVRLLGVDTPESHRNSKLKKDIKRSGQDEKEVLLAGKKAAEFTENFAVGKEARLEFEDKHKKDFFKRTLAYVYIGGKSLNETLIISGYACAYVKYPFTKKSKFVSLQVRAERERKGLWNTKELICR